MEPVRATITLRRPGPTKLRLLDHDGLPTEVMLPIQGGTIRLDTARDKTPYCVVEY